MKTALVLFVIFWSLALGLSGENLPAKAWQVGEGKVSEVLLPQAESGQRTDPPQNVMAQITAGGKLRLSWSPVTGAEGTVNIYRADTPAAPRDPAWTRVLLLPASYSQFDLPLETAGFFYLTHDPAVSIPPDLALVEGGSTAGITVGTFYIGKYEVTTDSWNYYVLGGSGDTFPRRDLSWLDTIMYCNARSVAEGLEPCYYFTLGGVNYGTAYSTWPNDPDYGWSWHDTGWMESCINWNTLANGYRLLTHAEWEYAARGGLLSQGYAFSGSNDINAVAWYGYSGIHPVGQKAPNELGLHDMSGNVWEWNWDWTSYHNRCRSGGGYNSSYDYCYVWSWFGTYAGAYESDFGFSVGRDAH